MASKKKITMDDVLLGRRLEEASKMKTPPEGFDVDNVEHRRLAVVYGWDFDYIPEERRNNFKIREGLVNMGDTENAFKANSFIDMLDNFPKKGNNKVKEYLSDEDVKAFNRSLTDVTLMKENLDKVTEEVFNNTEKTYNLVYGYFNMCINKNVMPTIATLCAFLGCTKKELFEYAKNLNCPSYLILSKGILLCNAFAEMAAINGAVDGRIFAFLAKNYYGMSDDTNINLKAERVDSASSVNNVETMRAIKDQLRSENSKKIIDIDDV